MTESAYDYEFLKELGLEDLAADWAAQSKTKEPDATASDETPGEETRQTERSEQPGSEPHQEAESEPSEDHEAEQSEEAESSEDQESEQPELLEETEEVDETEATDSPVSADPEMLAQVSEGLREVAAAAAEQLLAPEVEATPAPATARGATRAPTGTGRRPRRA